MFGFELYNSDLYSIYLKNLIFVFNLCSCLFYISHLYSIFSCFYYIIVFFSFGNLHLYSIFVHYYSISIYLYAMFYICIQ